MNYFFGNSQRFVSGPLSRSAPNCHVFFLLSLSHLFTWFPGNPFSCYCVILLTNKQNKPKNLFCLKTGLIQRFLKKLNLNIWKENWYNAAWTQLEETKTKITNMYSNQAQLWLCIVSYGRVKALKLQSWEQELFHWMVYLFCIFGFPLSFLYFV